MSVKYAMYLNPKSTAKEEKQPLHPRVIVQRTVRTPELAKIIGDTTTMSTADTKDVLEALACWISFYLENGCNVQLDGLGTFSLSLQSPPVMNPKKIDATSIRLKNINFRCSNELKKRLRDMTIEREPDAGSRDLICQEERKKRIVDYLSTYQSLTRTQCMHLNGCSKEIALQDLNSLIAEDKIMRLGNGKAILYISR